ncbi:Gfo/Idh/MocA family oxidoreductase [Microbacterium capsulatum]|uniref:Gfo/Idh/MocA family oxidoreductase n=1 Tax=Microbacterium capsulatum TaxID=3041921 RepID=A0ABU0XK60_9MICO|nr:Gfo/Idh/MocA family oxidoreductase [Microbacterium sp. ASV81]MDQ4215529.1 Gfo/Idh/MocA family oxidoreductase [Microbacterium sp. ASV81]
MRIGLIGAGAVAPFHVRAAAELAGAELTAVCDIDEASARRAADLAPGARVFTDHRRMIDAHAVDAVIVNTPHALHPPMAVDAAQAGLHVLVEKPMATSVEDCDRIAAACAAAGVALAVGHIQHHLPDKVAAHELIASGELGAVRLIRDNRSTDYRPGTRSPWFFSREVAGGGALFNIGAHCLDRSLWFGGARALEVSASVANRFGSPVETDGIVRLRLENGVGVAIAIVSDPPTRADTLAVVCERGTVEADPRAGTLVRIDGATRMVREPSPDDIQIGFTAQLADFLDVVHGGTPAVPLEHARHVVELILASYRSAQAGAATAVSPIPAATR